MALESFNAYHSYLKAIEPLNDAEVGRLTLAMMKYKSQGVEPVFAGNERFVWPAIKRGIAPDMSEVPAVEVDYTVDTETGEIKEQPEA